MELLSMERIKQTYKLEFSETSGDTRMNFKITFKEKWSLIKDYSGHSMGFFVLGEVKTFPYDSKNNLYTMPIHIPHPHGRYMFKACLDFFAKETSAPIHTTVVEHPGYPLIAVTFDINILPLTILEHVVTTILNSIQKAVVEKEFIEPEIEEKESDPLDEIDENVTFEFEVDEELKELMKQPVSVKILPLGGGNEDD